VGTSLLSENQPKFFRPLNALYLLYQAVISPFWIEQIIHLHSHPIGFNT